MAKINLIKNNFTSGELSPHIWMRTDLQQYRNGTKEMLNFLPIVEGGLKRRGGTEALAVTAGAVRILPFIISHSTAYILVFKALSIDVLDSNGTLVKSLSTPYTVQDIKELNYTQNRYQFFIAHGRHPLAWLRASEDLTNWAYDAFDFYVPPLEEVETPTLPLKPNEKSAGKVATLVASPYDIYDNTKRYQAGDVCHYTIGNTKYYFRAKRITQGNTPTLGGSGPEANPDYYWETTTVTEAQAFTAADVDKFVFINEGIVRIDAYVSPSTVKGEILLKLSTDIEAIGNSWVLKQDIFEKNLGYVLPIIKRQGNTLTIDCDPSVNQVYIGRKFTSRVSLFAPELQGSPATSSPSIIKINHINLYLYESLNPTVNGEMVELKQFTENFFEAPKPFTGNKRIEMNGWADFDNFKLIIEQSEPLPLHITAVVMEQNINDR